MNLISREGWSSELVVYGVCCLTLPGACCCCCGPVVGRWRSTSACRFKSLTSWEPVSECRRSVNSCGLCTNCLSNSAQRASSVLSSAGFLLLATRTLSSNPACLMMASCLASWSSEPVMKPRVPLSFSAKTRFLAIKSSSFEVIAARSSAYASALVVCSACGLPLRHPYRYPLPLDCSHLSSGSMNTRNRKENKLGHLTWSRTDTLPY
ncbi:hypothetical protein ABBQ38_006580 [Trebouxia sp. C0009 RCD-2024]